MTTTYNNPGTSLPVAYAHTVDYFSKGVDQDGPFYRVKYLIANWSDSDNFINALRGITTNTGGSSGTTVRTSPHRHPLSPNLYCVSATAEGAGAPITNANGYPNYTNGALITAEYRPIVPQDFVSSPEMLNQQIDPSTPLLWCTQELEFTTEYVTVKKSQVTYTAGPLNGIPVDGYAFRIRIPITIMSLTFHLVPYMPAFTVRNLQGKVNSSTFMGCTTGSCLFSGARVTREVNTDGTIAQKLMLTFMQRTGVKAGGAPAGATDQLWNSLPSNQDLFWYPVGGTGGALLYQSANLSPLVQF